MPEYFNKQSLQQQAQVILDCDAVNAGRFSMSESKRAKLIEWIARGQDDAVPGC